MTNELIKRTDDHQRRTAALDYLWQNSAEIVVSMADAVYADYGRSHNFGGWSAADAYNALVEWIGEQLERQDGRDCP